MGDEYTVAISHGEGRFVAPQQVLDKLIANGQVATQYVDLEGQPTMDQRYNPNGSVLAIEGLTSPDGRVFGKMGHAERSGEFLYKNVTCLLYTSPAGELLGETTKDYMFECCGEKLDMAQLQDCLLYTSRALGKEVSFCRNAWRFL